MRCVYLKRRNKIQIMGDRRSVLGAQSSNVFGVRVSTHSWEQEIRVVEFLSRCSRGLRGILLHTGVQSRRKVLERARAQREGTVAQLPRLLVLTIARSLT
jgi:hypothetical protein